MDLILSSIPALLTLAALEIVLGIDNIVFIAIVTAKLKEAQRATARRIGLALAAIGRIVLLFGITWLIMLQNVKVFQTDAFGLHVDMSVKDLVLLLGGLFLIGKATWEIHHNLEGDVHDHGHATDGANVARAATSTFGAVIVQILLLDLVFSIDSVLTAIGMVDPGDYPQDMWHFPGTTIPWLPIAIMTTAVLIAIAVMLLFVNPVSRFVETHPTVKMLALSFLVLIGVVLCAEAFHQAIPRGYIYSAMGFSLAVELLNQRVTAAKQRKRAAAAHA